jgi:hypothetical protein
MIGAQKARILVKNQWRTKTTRRFFFVSVHICCENAIPTNGVQGITGMTEGVATLF